MATARMTMAVASTRFATVSSRSETNLTKNGAHLSMAVPSVTPASISCSFSGFSLSIRSGRNAAIAARAADLEQDTLGGAAESFETAAASSPPAEPVQGSKLYVGNLPWTCDSQQLADVFQDVGNVELVEVIYDRETSRSRGFAFVTMASHKDALEAVAKLDGLEVGGRALKVNFPQSNKEPRTSNFRSERPPRGDGEYGGGSRGGSYNSPNKLFVGNLSWGVDDESLGQLFSDYGKVVDAKVVCDRESGRSRGFGFVTYSSSSEVNEAIQNLDGAEYDGRQLRVNLAGDKPPPRAY